MNDLTTSTNSTANRPTSPVLSPPLSELLESAGSPDEAAREIGRYSALLGEAREALPALKAVAEWKSGREGVQAVVGRRFALFPQPERNDGEWEAWWADYYDVLSDVPLACLEAAMRAYIARPGAEFMPKPGQLRDLAYTTVSKSLRRYQRAKRAIQLADQPTTPALPSAEPEGVHDPDAVKRMLAEYLETRKTTTQKPDLPSIAGKTDERGVTPEMRALMARRQGQ